MLLSGVGLVGLVGLGLGGPVGLGGGGGGWVEKLVLQILNL